jgi:alpha-glucosidase
VLSWLRKSGDGTAVVVVCNFTAKPQKVSLDMGKQGIRSGNVVTLLKTPGTDDPASLLAITLKPFGVYLLQVR